MHEWDKETYQLSLKKLWVIFLILYYDFSSPDSMRKTLYSGKSRVAPIVKLATAIKTLYGSSAVPVTSQNHLHHLSLKSYLD